MKRLSGILMMAAVLMFTATACLDEETSAVDVSGEATIKGVVTLFNNEISGDIIRANNATIRVWYDAAQLSINGTGPSRTVIIETTTNANGEFSVTVPTVPKGATFFVKVDDFETTYTEDDGGSGETHPAVFEDPLSNRSVFIRVGETKVLEGIQLSVKDIFED